MRGGNWSPLKRIMMGVVPAQARIEMNSANDPSQCIFSRRACGCWCVTAGVVGAAMSSLLHSYLYNENTPPPSAKSSRRSDKGSPGYCFDLMSPDKSVTTSPALPWRTGLEEQGRLTPVEQKILVRREMESSSPFSSALGSPSFLSGSLSPTSCHKAACPLSPASPRPHRRLFSPNEKGEAEEGRRSSSVTRKTRGLCAAESQPRSASAPPSRQALRSIGNIMGHGQSVSQRGGVEKVQASKAGVGPKKVLVLDARTGRPWQADRAPLAAQEDLAWLDDVCGSPQREEEGEEEEVVEEEGEEEHDAETPEEGETETPGGVEKEEVEWEVEEEEEKDLLGLEPITPARTRQTMSRTVPPPVNPQSSTFSALPSRLAPPAAPASASATHPSMPPPPPPASSTTFTSTASWRGLITSAAAWSSSPPPSSSTNAPSSSTHPPSASLSSAPGTTRVHSSEGGSDAPSQSAVSSGSTRPLLSSSSAGASTRHLRCFSVESTTTVLPIPLSDVETQQATALYDVDSDVALHGEGLPTRDEVRGQPSSSPHTRAWMEYPSTEWREGDTVGGREWRRGEGEGGSDDLFVSSSEDEENEADEGYDDGAQRHWEAEQDGRGEWEEEEEGVAEPRACEGEDDDFLRCEETLEPEGYGEDADEPSHSPRGDGDCLGPVQGEREGWAMSVEVDGGEGGHESLPSLNSSCGSSPLGTRLLSSPTPTPLTASPLQTTPPRRAQAAEEPTEPTSVELTPRPHTPASSPPLSDLTNRSDSTLRLLDQARAIRTPQPLDTLRLRELLEEGATSFARFCVSETARAMLEKQLRAEAEHAQRLAAWREGGAEEIDMEVLGEDRHDEEGEEEEPLESLDALSVEPEHFKTHRHQTTTSVPPSAKASSDHEVEAESKVAAPQQLLACEPVAAETTAVPSPTRPSAPRQVKAAAHPPAPVVHAADPLPQVPSHSPFEVPQSHHHQQQPPQPGPLSLSTSRPRAPLRPAARPSLPSLSAPDLRSHPPCPATTSPLIASTTSPAAMPSKSPSAAADESTSHPAPKASTTAPPLPTPTPQPVLSAPSPRLPLPTSHSAPSPVALPSVQRMPAAPAAFSSTPLPSLHPTHPPAPSSSSSSSSPSPPCPSLTPPPFTATLPNPPPCPGLSSPGRPNSAFQSSTSSLFTPPPSPTAPSGPCLLLGAEHAPVLVHPDRPHEHQALTEIHLSGYACEAVIATIPILPSPAAPTASPAHPLVIRASVHFASSQGAFFDVSPPYLYLGHPRPASTKLGPPQPSPSSPSPTRELKVRLLADRPGRYSAFLLLDYSGVRARVAISGHIQAKGTGGWLTARAPSPPPQTRRHTPRPQVQEPEPPVHSATQGPPQAKQAHPPAAAAHEVHPPRQHRKGEQGQMALQTSSGRLPDSRSEVESATPPAVGFGRVCVGCAVSRELRLRNCMTSRCFVRTHVEGSGFEADGGGEVGPNGLIKLLVTFKPNAPSHAQPDSMGGSMPPPAGGSGKGEVAMEGTLRVVVWEGQGLGQEEREQLDQGRHELSAQDGTLRCTTKTGRRVYTVQLQGTAVLPSPPPPRHSDDDATFDSMTLSGDSALGVSMGRSSGNQLAYHQQPQHTHRRHPDRHRFSAQPLPLAPPSTEGRDVALHPSVPPSLASLAGGAGVGACLGSSVFFGLDSLDFGGREIGGVATLKIPLCNPHKAPQLVVIQPLSLPFVVTHRSVTLRGRAFVRLPLRFVPVTSGSFTASLRAEIHPLPLHGSHAHTLSASSATASTSSTRAPSPKIITLTLQGHGITIK